MKTAFTHTLLAAALSAGLLASAYVRADGGNPIPVAPAPSTQVDLAPIQADSPSIPPNYDTYLLSQGKEVYAQLQIARQAAMNKNQSGFITALGLARDALDKVRVPAQVTALDKQLGIIKQDLGSQGGKLDAGLWVPVEARLRDALVFSSDDIISQATASVQKGMQAAQNNDPATVKTALEEVVDASTYNLGVFPLSKVKEDLDSASEAADDDTPYWAGALEAVQSALATFHWYEQVPSHGLLAAYTHAVSAYTLAASPEFRPDQRQAVLDQLGKAGDELQKAPDTGALQTQIRSLIDSVTPAAQDIKPLLQNLQQQISDQRQQSENQYLQNIAAETVNTP